MQVLGFVTLSILERFSQKQLFIIWDHFDYSLLTIGNLNFLSYKVLGQLQCFTISGLPQYTEHGNAIILVNIKTAKYLFSSAVF